MIRFLLSTITALFFICSCSTYYLQLATISSKDVKINDNGDFLYSDSNITIAYDFWSSYGMMTFVITNNTDQVIFIDLSQSDFIRNGFANDYYKGRTFVHSEGVTTLEQATKQTKSSHSFSAAVFSNYNNSMATASSVVGVTTKQVGTSISGGVSSGYAVEYKEQEIVRIPAHSSKSFGEFSLSEGVYRECGLPRDPNKKETAVKEFNLIDSPIIFKNNFVFIINEQEIPVSNEFYVSKVKNISETEAIEERTIYDCNGYYVNRQKFIKEASADKYYIFYDLSLDGQTDRVNKGKMDVNAW